MTARWFGVPGEGGRDAPAPGIWRSNVGGFSHGARQKVSEGDVSTGAREQETSVVETEARGILVPFPEESRKASQGKDIQRRWRPPDPDGVHGHPSRGKGAPGAKQPARARAYPSVVESGEPV